MRALNALSYAAACVALAAPLHAGTVRITVRGSVEWNQFSSGALAGIPSGAPAEMTFDVDSAVYSNDPSFPTRGYVISPGAFSLRVGAATVGLLNPLPAGVTPYFVLRNNDPHVDGFFIGTSTSYPDEIPLDIGVPNYGIAFSRGFDNEDVLPSLDILQALGHWEYEFLSSYNWTVQRGDFSTPLGIGYESISLELIPSCGSADFNCDGDLGTDLDIEAFFACLAGNCPASPCASTADFNGDGDIGTDADIESFFRVLAGGPC